MDLLLRGFNDPMIVLGGLSHPRLNRQGEDTFPHREASAAQTRLVPRPV